ncbi:winged helix-turn-helix domain-containing protein [Vibrio cyclitrophicus]|nr:winged helix-turn-helix domain-containing protein [Vibrio cyclitrophicus]UPR50506.1 winged helix-turn-helix domain-containing protein [Vibrio cyclitrophicus]
MTHTINLNGLTLDIDARTITNSQGNKIILRPHLLAVLCLLLDNVGRPISREHIVDVCWDGQLSSPHVLANVVYNQRNVFARLRTPNVQIITISKFGYALSIEPT